MSSVASTRWRDPEDESFGDHERDEDDDDRDDRWDWEGMWTTRSESEFVRPRADHSMSDDGATGTVVHFGGRDETWLSDAETWLFDGMSWSPRNPVTKPLARHGAAMAYCRPRALSFSSVGRGGAAETWQLVAGPDFVLGISSDSASVARGGSAAYTDAVQRDVGFNGPVDLTVAGLPDGASGAFDPNPAGEVSTLTVATSKTTKPGTYPFTVTATGGGRTQTATASLTVSRR